MKKLIFVCVFFVCCNYFSFGQSVSCKTFLQGAYQSGSLMNTSLTGLIPGTQPYTADPWNYPGTESLNSISANMVDWVLVELRNSSDPTMVISRRAAILLSNGEIADTNLTTSVNFPNISPGNYYLCIYHRNHLAVMSENPIAVPNSTSYNFSDTLNFPPYGGGYRTLIELEPGIYGMIAGDVNKDGTIKYSGPANDRGPVLQYIVNQSGSTSITTTVSGYNEADINMDSIIKYSGQGNDPSLIIQNLVGLTGSTSITSVYHSIVPSGITPYQCGDTILDQRDGQKYSTILIGNQCWIAENLAYLPAVFPSDSGAYTTPYYYVYDYQGTSVTAAKATTNYQTYGVLYNWPAAMAGEASSNSVPSGVQGICPSGWHLPGDEEWKILEGAVDSQYGYPDPEWNGTGWQGADAGGNLKETGEIHWNSPNTGATNSSGFTTLPGGYLYTNSSFSNLGYSTRFWSSTEFSSSNAWHRSLHNSGADVGRYYDLKEYGFYIRCLKDICTQPTQSNAGPDFLNIAGDSIALMGNIPIDGQGLWTIISGSGGSFADATNPTTMFYGFPGNTYNLVWTISNNCGSSSDTVRIGFIYPNCGIITDARDGSTYNTVVIGSQCWMAENLAYLPQVNLLNTFSQISPYYYVYGYQGTDVAAAKATSNYQTYGVLYNWPAAMAGEASSNNVPSGVKGVCPAGWHLPGDEEWKILEGEVDSQYVYPDPEWDGTGWRGSDVGGNLKETGTTHWSAPNTGATNSSGFLALPGGSRHNYSVNNLGDYAVFWSSAEVSIDNAWPRFLVFSTNDVSRGPVLKSYGHSVRCVKDCNPQPTQSDAGADLYNIQVDSTTLLANTPQNGQGLWTIANGTGGSFSDPTNPTSIFYGVPPNTYYLVWTISNNCGSSFDTVRIGFIYPNCGIITDARDGNTYITVVIGSQCWMAENLNATQYPDGTPIPLVTDNIVWGNLGDNDTDDAYCIINNNSGGEAGTYGALYTWAAAMGGNAVSSSSNPSGVQGICPTGWHLPSDTEWTQLTDYLGGESVAGGKLKATSLWFSPNTGATNETGFTGLPGGDRSSSTGSFDEFEYGGYWWGSTEEDNYTVWRRRLYYTGANVNRANGNKSGGYSVRCVLD